MPSEIGSIVEGRVVKITKFGAFVELEDGSQGLVHISQIANQFIRDVSEHLKINDIVKVKILSRDKKDYFELSIKDVREKPKKPKQKDELFEEKLTKFLKKSNERLLDLKRNMESKRSGGGIMKY